MIVQVDVELNSELEKMLRELTAVWASKERMENSESPFQIQAQECCARGIRELHDELLARKARAA
jgi:hypothetical protein